MKAVFPTMLVLAVGAIVMLVAFVGSVTSNRANLKAAEAEALRGQFSYLRNRT